MSRFLRVALLTASVATASLNATAQTRDPAGAEKLYDDGSKLLAKGDWPGACAEFAKSFELDPAPGTMLNLSACAEHDGKLALAWSRLKDARSLNKDTQSEKQRQEIEAFIASSLTRLEPRIPYLTVKVAGALSGVTVKRDGQPTAVDTELPIDPGTHLVEASAPGFLVAKREIVIREGAHESVELALEPAPPGAPSDTPARVPDAPPKPAPPVTSAPPDSPEAGLGAVRLTGIILGSVGVAAFGVTIGTGVAALGKQSELTSLGCVEAAGGGYACPPANVSSGQDVSDAGSTLAIASTVTTFVGGALLGAGVLMVVLGGEDGPEPARTGFAPILGPGVAGATFQGSF